MLGQLTSIVEHMNLTSGATGTNTEMSTINCITKILNEHLTSLEWIDEKSVEFAKRLEILKLAEAESWKLKERVHH